MSPPAKTRPAVTSTQCSQTSSTGTPSSAATARAAADRPPLTWSSPRTRPRITTTGHWSAGPATRGPTCCAAAGTNEAHTSSGAQPAPSATAVTTRLSRRSTVACSAANAVTTTIGTTGAYRGGRGRDGRSPERPGHTVVAWFSGLVRKAVVVRGAVGVVLVVV